MPFKKIPPIHALPIQTTFVPPKALMMARQLGVRATPLYARPAAPLVQPRNEDIDRTMWRGVSPPQPLRIIPPQMPFDMDTPRQVLNVNMQAPESQDPNTPVYINSNCPPWVCPPNESVPFDLPMTACVPWYEVDTLLQSSYTVPLGKMLIIKSCSYEALNASLNDVFQFRILVNGAPKATFEDAYADSTAVNPAQKYGLSGHFRPLPLGFIADRQTVVSVYGKLRGAISLTGVSPNLPGTPIASGNCQMKLILNGWLAVDRMHLEGGPRPTDLGDSDMHHLEEDQMGSGG
jgi:hypothetical protein